MSDKRAPGAIGETIDETRILDAAMAAARAVPPAWPLAATVAVNPFLGQSGERLSVAAARLARAAGARLTMPRSWYAEEIAAGRIGRTDLAEALAAAPAAMRPPDLAALEAALAAPTSPAVPLPTVADLAAEVSGIDWPGLIADRIGAWAAAWFDAGQALWTGPNDGDAYAAWRATAMHDLVPEIIGLHGFARYVERAPDRALAALARASTRLGLAQPALESCYHRLLLTLGGWAQCARQRLWDAELAGGRDRTILDLLAIRTIWEEALLEQYGAQIGTRWAETVLRHAEPVHPGPETVIDEILQEAAERAAQRALAATLAAPSAAPVQGHPAVQVAFCIDVRSEVFRRALESVDPHVQTIGFAGFFGLPLAHRRFASDETEPRCPVLLRPALPSHTSAPSTADGGARIRARARRAWGRFKLAAVSSFAFVEATGPVYAGKLLGDGLGLGRRRSAEPPPRLDPGIDVAARTGIAAQVLRAMSLTRDFARLVLLVGHGASVANNPFASALQCGACGGYPGDANARMLAALLNDPEVRAGLVRAGITIPDDTLFLGALHDTTTERVTLFASDHPAPAHAADLATVSGWLARASALAAAERRRHLPRASGRGALERRSRDWSEVRPEWGLAGCMAFIAAPRALTLGRDLQGHAFLHDYDWREDRDFKILELILTAPVVVASWISLQYYGSTVAPAVFGSGNKLLHNVVGGTGVLEGNGGVLRTGLPWQSVHDGERIVHRPLRLTVCIEAPPDAIGDILARHPHVRELFDNRWLHLLALDGGRLAQRYVGDGRWGAAFSDAVSEPAATLS